MIVEAIADFTPGVLAKLKGATTAETSSGRERSRSREKESNQESRTACQPVNDSSFLTEGGKSEDEKVKEDTRYTFFVKDDLIKVTANAGNGWWYGYVIDSYEGDEGDVHHQGFFPFNYVQQLKSLDQQENPTQETTQGGSSSTILEGMAQFSQEDQVYDPLDVDYASYAKTNFADRDRVSFDEFSLP